MPSLIGNKPNQVPSNGDLGTLAFQDANAVKITGGDVDVSTLNTTGNVGIGTTPSVWRSTNKALQIGQSASVFGYTASNIVGLATNSYIDSSGDEKYITNGTGGSYFIGPSSGEHRWNIYSNNTSGAGASLTPTEVMRITSTGVVQLAQGQIKFPATQVASADANTLDDYEEGTWTPSIGGTATYTAQYGYYTKIGNSVTVTFTIQINVIGTGGIYTMNSLPFIARSVAVPVGSVGYFSGINTNVYSLNCYIDPNTVNLSFVGQTSLASSNAVPINVFKNGALIYGTATYFV